MKKSFVLSLLVILYFQSFGNNIISEPILHVFATSGLSLRTAPDQNAEIIKIIPFGEKVIRTVKEDATTHSQRIGWVDGEWIFVIHEGESGYIFDGFLSRLPAPLYDFEFSQFDMELIYPLESWAERNFVTVDSPDTITTNQFSKVVTRFITGEKMVRLNKNGYYKMDLYLSDVRAMDVYHLLLGMFTEDSAAEYFIQNAVFVESNTGEIDKIRIDLEDDITIKKLRDGRVNVSIVSTQHHCAM